MGQGLDKVNVKQQMRVVLQWSFAVRFRKIALTSDLYDFFMILYMPGQGQTISMV